MPALDGLRILDMTQYEAGTSCTQALAWMGADIVKVEPPGTGDPGRGVTMDVGQDSEYFVNWNSNKRSVVLDLRKPEGREVLLKMTPHYDVFIENYGPGVIEKLDIGYDVMKALNPGIIYARIKGFGTSGPYADYKCFDMVAQAASGAMSITGEPDGPPVRCGPTISDSGTGVQMALAITGAYVQKLRTGEGQLVELSMQEATTYFMRTGISMGTRWGKRAARRNGNGADPMSCMYPCKPFGPNDYVYIMGVTARMQKAVYEVIGRPELLEDERFNTPKKRRENSAVLFEEIAKWTRERTKHEAMKTFAEAGVPSSGVNDTKDVFDDPHLNARGFIHTLEHEELGTIRLLGWPAQFSKSHVPIKPAPLLGQHTASVLKADLGLSQEELQALHDRGAINIEKNE